MKETLKQQSPSLETLQAEDLIPKDAIDELLNIKVDHRTARATNPNFHSGMSEHTALAYHLYLLVDAGYITEQQADFFYGHSLNGHTNLNRLLASLDLPTQPHQHVNFSGEYQGEEVYTVYLSHINQDELHFTDIALNNIFERLSPEEENRLRAEYKGLGNGIFDSILIRIREFAKKSGYKRISLIASDWRRVATFHKRGYQIKTGILQHRATYLSGRGMPMILELD